MSSLCRCLLFYALRSWIELLEFNKPLYVLEHSGKYVVWPTFFWMYVSKCIFQCTNWKHFIGYHSRKHWGKYMQSGLSERNLTWWNMRWRISLISLALIIQCITVATTSNTFIWKCWNTPSFTILLEFIMISWIKFMKIFFYCVKINTTNHFLPVRLYNYKTSLISYYSLKAGISIVNCLNQL